MIKEIFPIEYKNWTEYYREKNARYSFAKTLEAYLTVAAYILFAVMGVLGAVWLAAFADFVTMH